MITKRMGIIFVSIFLLVSISSSYGYSQKLVISLSQQPLQIDPRYAIDANSGKVIQLVYNGLLRRNRKGMLEPDLISSWTREGDKTYKIRLKDNIFFHNGEKLSAKDVAATYLSILDPKMVSPKRGSMMVIDSIETPSENEIIFHLKKAYAPFPELLTLGIIPASWKDKKGDIKHPPPGTGAFRFIKWKGTQKLLLSANEKYHRGAPRIKRIEFRIIPDATTRLLELIKGKIHLIQNDISIDLIKKVKTEKHLKVITYPGTNYTYLGFNLKDPILKNIEVRRAIAYAIDKKALIKYLMGGYARVAISPFPREHWAFTSDVETYPYNPKKAIRLLDKAGFHAKKGGVRIRLIYKTSKNSLARKKAEIIQQQLASVGIKISIRSFDWSTFFRDIRTGNFQIYSMEWVGINDPDILYYIFHSKSTPPKGANRGYYSNKEMDELLELGRRTLDIEKRKIIYHRIQKILSHDLPYISLWHATNIIILHKDLKGFIPYPAAQLYSLEKVYWSH